MRIFEFTKSVQDALTMDAYDLGIDMDRYTELSNQYDDDADDGDQMNKRGSASGDGRNNANGTEGPEDQAHDGDDDEDLDDQNVDYVDMDEEVDSGIEMSSVLKHIRKLINKDLKFQLGRLIKTQKKSLHIIFGDDLIELERVQHTLMGLQANLKTLRNVMWQYF